MRTALIVIVVTAIAGTLYWLFGVDDGAETFRRERPPTPVTAVVLEPQDYRDEISALGTLQAWESVDISPSVSQNIVALMFEDGQQVKKGDLLAVLKQDAEQATLRELQASLEDRQREVKRLVNLARRNQVAQTDLDKVSTEVQVIGHQIEEVQSRIADRTLIAPFDGVLGLREVSEGALVSPGQRITTLDDISKLRLQFSVSALRLAFLKPGQAVSASTPAFDQVFTGTVAAVDSRVDTVSRAITARATLPNADNLLRPGMLMEVTINGPQRQALLIPEESLQSRAAIHYVWKIEGDKAVRTEVEISGRRPGWVEITRGLAAGDSIVRDGVGSLGGNSAMITIVEG
jgi:membrane fusion protein (multidrug efflux system)